MHYMYCVSVSAVTTPLWSEDDELNVYLKLKPVPPEGKSQPKTVITSVVCMTMQSSVKSPLKQEIRLFQ